MDKNLSFDLSPTLWTPNSNLVLLPLADLCLSLSHTQSHCSHSTEPKKHSVRSTHPPQKNKETSLSLFASLSLSLSLSLIKTQVHFLSLSLLNHFLLYIINKTHSIKTFCFSRTVTILFKTHKKSEAFVWYIYSKFESFFNYWELKVQAQLKLWTLLGHTTLNEFRSL